MNDLESLKRRLRDPRRLRMREFQKAADRISFMIVATDYPLVDISIARSKLRDRAEELFPGRGGFFDMIYESRFDRLIEQFRPDDERPF